MNDSLICSSAILASVVAFAASSVAGPIDSPGPEYRKQLELLDLQRSSADPYQIRVVTPSVEINRRFNDSPVIGPIPPVADFSQPIRLFPADKALVPVISGTGVLRTVPVATPATPAPAK
jgi:hypothetical protein